MKHEIPVIVMEPVKGGTLANLRSDVGDILHEANPGTSFASWAIRYSASLDGIITVLSGMSDTDQLDDNVSYMERFQPLDSGERTVIEKAVEALKSVELIGCTACKYCVNDCPQNIGIPSIFELVNEFRVYRDLAYAKRRYGNTMKESGKASDCIACGSCESHCPQKLEIIRLLNEAALQLE